MRRLLLIFKLLLKAKFTFKNPQEHKLVIFDDESYLDMKNFISDRNFFLLQTRVENINKIYLSFQIIKYFFKYYIKYFFKYDKGIIMTAYLSSLLEIVRPKVVLTNITNSPKFFDIAKIFDNKINFVSIQNGICYDLKRDKHLYKVKKINSDLTKNYYIPNLLCFGQFEIDHYKKYEIKVKNFSKVGSLQMANFFYHIEKNKISLKKSLYDICLISNFMPAGSNDKWVVPSLEEGLAKTTKYTINFCMKHNLKMIFTWRRNKKTSPKAFDDEVVFYKKHLNDIEFNYLVSSIYIEKDKFSSYKAMFQSNIAIGTYTTMLSENLGTGGKILACNCTYSDIFDFPIEGICSIKNCNFKEFEKRLLDIHSISKENYFSRLSKDKHYVMEYNEKISTIEILRKKIDLFLADELSDKKSAIENLIF